MKPENLDRLIWPSLGISVASLITIVAFDLTGWWLTGAIILATLFWAFATFNALIDIPFESRRKNDNDN